MGEGSPRGHVTFGRALGHVDLEHPRPYKAAVTWIATRCLGVASFATMNVHAGGSCQGTHASHVVLISSKQRESEQYSVAVRSFDLLLPHRANASSIWARTWRACSAAVGAGSRATCAAR